MQDDDRSALEDETARAANAKRILEDPLVAGALDALEQQAYRTWCGSTPGDSVGRERCYFQYQAFRFFRASLTRHIETGIMAGHQLAELEGSGGGDGSSNGGSGA